MLDFSVLEKLNFSERKRNSVRNSRTMPNKRPYQSGGGWIVFIFGWIENETNFLSGLKLKQVFFEVLCAFIY